MDTPPLVGVWMLTVGVPLAEFNTVGRWLLGAFLSPMISACATGNKTTLPKANMNEKLMTFKLICLPVLIPELGPPCVSPALLPSLMAISATAIIWPRFLLKMTL